MMCKGLDFGEIKIIFSIKHNISKLMHSALNIDSQTKKDYKTLNLCKFSYKFMFEQIQQEI